MQLLTTPQTQTAPGSQDDAICLRSITTGALLTVLMTSLLLAAHQSACAWGFLIGAMLSLLSLVSLTVVVPMLFQPNAPRYTSLLLVFLLFMKLPMFVVGLYLMTHLRGVAPAAGAVGIGLGPVVIALRTVSGMLMQSLRNARPAAVENAPEETEEAETAPLTQTTHCLRARLAELASE